MKSTIDRPLAESIPQSEGGYLRQLKTIRRQRRISLLIPMRKNVRKHLQLFAAKEGISVSECLRRIVADACIATCRKVVKQTRRAA
jgi:hypothetical protein